jgi:hypothetical protein
MPKSYKGGFITRSPNQPSTANGASGMWTPELVSFYKSKGRWPTPTPPVPPSLYVFTNASFTPGGSTGRFGPSLAQSRTGLTGTGVDAWKNNTEYFNTSSGIQLWTVPKTGTYTIEVWGAQGGRSTGTAGSGARMRGDFTLTQGEIISILVGQQGTSKSSGCNSGGGGGTFVWRQSSTTLPLIVAGGGGGAGEGCSTSGENAPTSTSGTGTWAGTGGNGGGPGGAGWLSNGGTGLDNANNGNQRPLAGGAGGAGNTTSVGDGGFGGGAGASGQSCGNGGPGGGGGYSGGSGPSATATCQNSGGGGSFNSGSNQSNTAGARTGDGLVTITSL